MTEPSTEIRIEAASVTDRGLNEKRPLNEDSLICDVERRVFAVADGVGGAEAGEVASETAVEVLQQAFAHHKDGDDAEDLMEIAIQRANASIFQMSRESPRFAMMATTIVALYIDGLRATVGHVGDSRLYRMTPDGTLQRETDDHSVVEEEVRAGRMTAQQAANHPSRNVISRALGAEQSVEVDMKTFEIEEGTTFLLCSDGITRHIMDEEMGKLLRAAGSLEDACAELKRLCYERGAEDNLTAIVVRVGERSSLPAHLEDTIDDEPTIIRQYDPFDVTQPYSQETHAPTLIQRPFDEAGRTSDEAAQTSVAEISPPSATPPPAPSASPNGSPAAAKKKGGGAGRVLGVLFLLIAASAAAFYGGMLAEQKGMLKKYGFASSTPAATPTPPPTPTPVSAEAEFVRQLRVVDLSPQSEVARMEADTANPPLNSTDPQVLYLYGRALLLTGRNKEAVSAFEKAIQRINENTTSRNAQLKLDVRLAEIAANLRDDNSDKAREAAKSLGEFIRQGAGETPANPSPSPVVTP